METADILNRINELFLPSFVWCLQNFSFFKTSAKSSFPITPANVLALSNLNLNAPELSQGCVSLLSLVYGQKSAQVQQFNTSLADIAKENASVGYKNQQVVIAWAERIMRKIDNVFGTK